MYIDQPICPEHLEGVVWVEAEIRQIQKRVRRQIGAFGKLPARSEHTSELPPGRSVTSDKQSCS